jgi:hypothetical protein
MRTTDFCFLLPEYEHPRLVSYRHLFETRASPMVSGLVPATKRPVNLAFHDAEFASVSFFGLARGTFLPGASDRAEPLTPLSLPGSCVPLARHTRNQVAKAASIASPVKVRRSLRPR